MEHSPGIRRTALEEFERRRQSWRKARREGAADWPGDPANENMTLWLAIAVAAGAGPDLPADARAQIEVTAIFPPGRKVMLRPEQIAEPLAWRAELARARNAAVDRYLAGNPKDLPREQRARDLIELAKALGAPPMPCRKEAGRATA